MRLQTLTRGNHMPDNKDLTGKPDRERINVNEPYELRDWSQQLGVPPDKLKELVRDHGPMVADIRKALGR